MATLLRSLLSGRVPLTLIPLHIYNLHRSAAPTCSETAFIGPSLVMTSRGRSSSTRGMSWKCRLGFRSMPHTWQIKRHIDVVNIKFILPFKALFLAKRKNQNLAAACLSGDVEGKRCDVDDALAKSRERRAGPLPLRGGLRKLPREPRSQEEVPRPHSALSRR